MTRVRIHDHVLAGRRTLVRDYLPPGRRGAWLLWVHGGGFAGGSIDMPESDAVARRIAATGRPVRTVDYRLAPALPESGPLDLAPSPDRYPAAQNDVIAAFLDLDTDGPVLLGGASAGACIAAGAAVRLRDAGGPQPRGLVLAYGVFHSRMPEPASGRGIPLPASHRRHSEWVRRMSLNYVGSVDLLDDPRAFPGQGDPAGLPDALILDAHDDMLRPSGRRFAQQLRDSGVRTTEQVVPESQHGFLNDPTKPPFHRGVNELLRWMHAAETRDSREGR